MPSQEELRDLASFFIRRDMAGPAQQLQAQGVAGEDFLDLIARVLQSDLRLSPFTARKLVRIRDAYLMEP